MRRKKWLLGIIAAFVACGLLILFRPTKEIKPDAPLELQTSVSNQMVHSKQSESIKAQKQNAAPNSRPVRSTVIASNAVRYNPNVIGPNLLTNWQAPIEFYGKVVDQNNNAMAGASVSFHWMEVPDEKGSRSTNAESDTEGLFSLQGARGPRLSISVSKKGYYSSRRDNDSASYGP